jgi:ATP-dependent RNA helicase HelY
MSNLSPAAAFQRAKQNKENNRRHPESIKYFATLDFAPDEFQIQACQALEDGFGVLVAAPTGAGKTIVGEFAAKLATLKGFRCFYTTPIKALSNQKFNELSVKFGSANVGLLTGDSNINPEAQVVVMTTEVLRNMIYSNSDNLKKLRYVVMDEVHYLADKFRGAVWEEILIHLPEEVRIVSLSATVSNAEEFGEWLQMVRGETKVIVSENRPVPLYQHVFFGNRLLDLFGEEQKLNPELTQMERNTYKSVKGNWSNKDRQPKSLSRPEVIMRLQKEKLLPAITFIFSRNGCDQAVRQCVLAGLRLNDQSEIAEIRKVVASNLKDIPSEDLAVIGYYEWIEGLQRGVAAHHAGLLPAFKVTVEQLFQRGLIKAVFATETLALGINMPARTVVLEKLSKWNGEAHVPISAGEYTQLTGRAGRRGIDIEGNAVIMWNKDLDSSSIGMLAATRTYPLRSSFKPSYNMSINLIARVDYEAARSLLEQSLAQFQADKAVVGLAKQVAKTERFKTDLIENFNQESKLGGKTDERSLAKHNEKVRRLDQEISGLNKRIESRTNVIAKRFDRILAILRKYQYIEADQVTKWGKLLGKIYAESDLLLAELIRRGVFNELAPRELVSVVSAIVFESRLDEEFQIPKGATTGALQKLSKIWGELNEEEIDHRVEPSRAPDFGFCTISYRWASGQSLSSVLKSTELTVGDFVRSMKQIVDLLRQLAIIAPDLKEICERALNLIDRGVVAFATV